MPIGVGALALAILAVAAGALLQSTIGFGAALVSAPLLLLVDARLVPGPATVAGIALNLLLVAGHRAHIEWDEVRWPALGLIPGTAVAAWAVTRFDQDRLVVISGLAILAGVAVSLMGAAPRRTRPNLLAAGFASGAMNTVASVGGPPLALLHRESSGQRMRAALPPVFVVSGLVTLLALRLAGHVGSDDLVLGVALIPGCVLGFLGARPLAGRVADQHLRTLVLVVSSAAAVAAILRAVA